MKALLTVVAAVFLGLAPAAALADDEAQVSSPFARVGEQLHLVLALTAPADAMVQIDPGDEAWVGVEVVHVVVLPQETTVEGTRHRLVVTVAFFEPGEHVITPAVLVIRRDDVERRELPAVQVAVPSVLRPGELLELSPLPAPERIGGAQSPWLVPGIIGGVALGVALILANAIGAVVLVRRWWAGRPEPSEPEPVPLPDVAVAESLMERDSVAAYRELARVIRTYLAAEYGFPARALTTEELQHRMERAGVDNWVARMSRDLLAECDAVVYAGYRPAVARRVGDLRVAREILGVEG